MAHCSSVAKMPTTFRRRRRRCHAEQGETPTRRRQMDASLCLCLLHCQFFARRCDDRGGRGREEEDAHNQLLLWRITRREETLSLSLSSSTAGSEWNADAAQQQDDTVLLLLPLTLFIEQLKSMLNALLLLLLVVVVGTPKSVIASNK